MIAVWGQALTGGTDGEHTRPPAAFLTTREALRDHGVGGAIWRTAAGDEGMLVEQIGWGAEPPVAPPPPALFDAIDDIEIADRRGHGAIRRWAPHRATVDTTRSRWQHAAALALATGADEQALLEWIARHPLLAAPDLAALRGETRALIERRLEWLVRCHAVGAARLHQSHGKEHHMQDEPEVRYVLTEQGMRFLASRAGVPQSTFGKRGGTTHTRESDGDHPERAVRHVEHTLGLNRFMVQLAGDAREHGWLLAEWRNEAESTCRFSDHTGRVAWIRPDASGVIDTGEERLPFLVEYDRGTLDAGDYRGKLEGYRRYYASEAWRMAFAREPALLFCCSDERAAERVSRAAASVDRSVPLLITTEARSSRHGSNPEGCVGAVWRQHVPGGELMRWLGAPQPEGADAE